MRTMPIRWFFAFATLAALICIASVPARTEAPTASGRGLSQLPTPSNAAIATPARAANSSRGTPRSDTTAAADRVLRSGSLRGSARDGALTFDAQGRLVGNRELRRRLDYYLSTIGELDMAAIRALLARELGVEYPPAAVAQVLDVFDRYAEYQRALVAASPDEDLRSRLDRLRELRRLHLGDELADAFFHEEETYAEYTLDQRSIRSDPTLAPDERERRLEQRDAQLPAAQRAERALTIAPALLAQQDAQFDADHADAGTRHHERAAIWGDEAAQRLDVLDGERAQWQARVNRYVSQRDAINNDPSRTAAQRRNAIEALLAGAFAQNERARILSLEQDGVLNAPGG